MIVIYTGNGKGKTSACVGQAIRALGQNIQVAFAQFMKRGQVAGEQTMLSRLLGEAYLAGGSGFFRDAAERPEHRRAAEQTLAWALARVPHVQLIVLDECLYALGAELLTPEEVQTFLACAREHTVHVVLSGRGLPDWLREEADIITEMQEVKHPWKQGVKAIRGIEF